MTSHLLSACRRAGRVTALDRLTPMMQDGRHRDCNPVISVGVALVLLMAPAGAQTPPPPGDSGRPRSDVRDSVRQRRTWFILHGLVLGGGYGTRVDETGGKSGGGLRGSVEVLEFAIGFGAPAGVGLGVKALELVQLASRQQNDALVKAGVTASVLPVYVYVPLRLASRQRLRGEAGTTVNRPRGIYLFGGGSGWGIKNTYWHAGVNTILFTMPPDPGGPIIYRANPITVGVRVGLYRTGPYQVNGVRVDGRWGGYVLVTTGAGGLF